MVGKVAATSLDADSLLAILDAASEEAPRPLGPYDVVGRLGQGGMGAVYEAIDRRHGTRVALKTIRRGQPDWSKGIKAEFRVVADLAHDNLVPVYELAHDQGLWFFTMELVQGVSFTDWLGGPMAAKGAAALVATTMAEDSPSWHSPDSLPQLPASAPERPENELRGAFQQLIHAVIALHDAGLRHGDIKPENVIVREDGRLVLVDFGLTESNAAAPLIGGTPCFTAPEQLRGEVTGPAADWYAVGIMLYMALTGRYPFGKNLASDHYLQKMIGLPPAPASLVDVPADLSALCLALLNPEAVRRPGAEEIASHFTAAAAKSKGPTLPKRSTFVGRQSQLWQLEHALQSVRETGTVVAHAHGPSGIGKSAVTTTFLDGVRDAATAKVLRGRCYERESIPYKAFDGIVDELSVWLSELGEQVAETLPNRSAELAQVFPALLNVPAIAEHAKKRPATADIAELPRTAQEALAELLAALSEVQPLVLSIDDLQWADASSADLLGALLDARTGARLLLLANFRTDEAAKNDFLVDYFERCRGDGFLVDVPIAALSERETTHMARSLLEGLFGHVDAKMVSAVVRTSEGVPFLVEELARHIAAHPGEHEELSLLQVVAARMQALPPDQHALLAVAAVADSPLSQPVIFDAAGLDTSALPALLALRHASMMRWAGPGTEAAVSTYHDGIREAVVHTLGADARAAIHLRLARAHMSHHGATTRQAWLFDVVRHLNSAAERVEDPAERLEAAQLNLRAGRRAKDGAAFGLAQRCFEAGIGFLEEGSWESHYALALDLHTGAAETAYLGARWDELRQHVAIIKTKGLTVLDQLVARLAEIDAYIGHRDYVAAIDVGSEALELLGTSLATDPTPEEVGAAFTLALGALERVQASGLLALPDVHDPEVAAAMRIQVRMSPAAYYSRPAMLPLLASNLVVMSIERGLSPATPYALAVCGIVLNSVGMLPQAHDWGVVAEELIDRWADRKLEVCTRHVLQCLVCNWMVPMESTLDGLRAVFDMGRESGDLEYASYAAHGYIYNAINAARPLGPLLEEALQLGQTMRNLGQVNAVHVHAPFEQVLRCLRGDNPDPSRLDGHGFDEKAELASATAEGSRHGLFVLHYTIGLVRFHSGRADAARLCFDSARLYIDAAVSAWHVPILHQLSALAACRAWPDIAHDERAEARAKIDESLEALRSLAGHSPVNFAHRVHLVEGAIASMEMDFPSALAHLDRAIAAAAEGGWTNDVALAHEVAARCEQDPEARRQRISAAKDAYETWGATAKVERLLEALRSDP